MSVSTRVAGRGVDVGLGVGVSNGSAIRDGVEVTVGEKDAVIVFVTRVGPVACAVGVGIAVLVGSDGVGVSVLDDAVDLEICSSSPGRSNTNCATARSFDPWVAAIFASAAQITPMSRISARITIPRRFFTATVLSQPSRLPP